MKYMKNGLDRNRILVFGFYLVLFVFALYEVHLSPSFTMMFFAANVGLCGLGELVCFWGAGRVDGKEGRLAFGKGRFSMAFFLEALGDLLFLVGMIFSYPAVYIYAVGDDLLKWWPFAAVFFGSGLTLLVVWHGRKKGRSRGVFRELILWISFTGGFFALFCGISSPVMGFYGAALLVLGALKAGQECKRVRGKEPPGVKQYLAVAGATLLLAAVGFGNAYPIAELAFVLGSGPSFLYENQDREMAAGAEEFLPGALWTDTEGNTIQAHGGQIQRMPVPDGAGGRTEKYVWIGENKSGGQMGNCFSVYSSEDLHNWTFEGDVLRSVESMEQLEEDPYFADLYADYTEEQLSEVFDCINISTVMERPKMLYNEKTEKYVLWFHSDDSTEKNSSYKYDVGMAGVAISDSPFGPFRFLGRYRLNQCPSGQMDCFPWSKGEARDLNLFKDEDGTAYVVYTSENNKTLYISKLNEAYTNLCADPEEAVYGVDYIRLFPGTMREAPVLTRGDNGRYYLMSSSTTGWMSNQARVWSADAIFGKWRNDGNPCQGAGASVTFDTQSTCLFQREDGQWIYYGDRWNLTDLADSRYVWLPVEFEGEKLTISWEEAWR